MTDEQILRAWRTQGSVEAAVRATGASRDRIRRVIREAGISRGRGAHQKAVHKNTTMRIVTMRKSGMEWRDISELLGLPINCAQVRYSAFVAGKTYR